MYTGTPLLRARALRSLELGLVLTRLELIILACRVIGLSTDSMGSFKLLLAGNLSRRLYHWMLVSQQHRDAD